MFLVQENNNSSNKVKKRVFVGLLACSFVILMAIVAFAWWVVTRPAIFLNKFILTVALACVIILIILLAFGIGGLVWSLWRSKNVVSLQSAMHTAINFLFPLALSLGKWFGMDEMKIKNSYIQVSNQLAKTKTNNKHEIIERVMILAPHCLQWAHCPHKITIDVNNCKGCGKCPIADLIKLVKKHDAYLMIATGGTMARKAIKEYRPQAVVAVACERDLTSGIQDVVGLPVVGVVNERPEGPCTNTRVDLNKVEEAIKFFKQGG